MKKIEVGQVYRSAPDSARPCVFHVLALGDETQGVMVRNMTEGYNGRFNVGVFEEEVARGVVELIAETNRWPSEDRIECGVTLRTTYMPSGEHYAVFNWDGWGRRDYKTRKGAERRLGHLAEVQRVWRNLHGEMPSATEAEFMHAVKVGGTDENVPSVFRMGWAEIADGAARLTAEGEAALDLYRASQSK